MFSTDALPFWTAVAAMAAAGSALFAALYTFLTFRLVQIHDQARVVVFVRHDLDRPTILCIRIENIGRDIARDVQFTSSKLIPVHAYGIDPATANEAKTMSEGPIVEGIPALGPGDAREITWGQYGGLTKALGADSIVLDYKYRSGKRTLRGSAVLEARSYYDTDASSGPTVVATRALERIAKASEDTKQALAAIAGSLGERR